MADISFLGVFACSAFAACFAEFCTLPLDTAKVRLQLQKKAVLGEGAGASSKYRGMIGTVATIAREEGLYSLWKGIVPGLHRQFLYGGLRIGLYEPVKAYLFGSNVVGDDYLFNKILAAMVTGAIAIVVANPTDLVKVRLQAEGKLTTDSSRRYSGALDAYRTIIKQEGLTALWTGLVPNIARNTIINAAELASYDHLKQTILEIPGFTDNILTHLLAGLGAGFFAVCIGSPVHVAYWLGHRKEMAPRMQENALNATSLNANSASITAKKGVRGPTFMRNIWGQSDDENIHVEFNKYGQPIDKGSSTFSHFLGMVARNGRYAPLHHKSWIKVPQVNKSDMIDLVKSKFDIPPGHESYILKSIAKKWRTWKSILKSENYDPTLSVEEQLNNVPNRVQEDQWRALLKYWDSLEGKKISANNKANRKELKMIHCMGKTSFAKVEKMMEKDYGHCPSRAEKFMFCYTRKDKRPINEVASRAMVQMKELFDQAPEGYEDNCGPNDIYSQVMGNEKPGRVRMYGLGISASDIWGIIPSRETSYGLAVEYKEKLSRMEEKCEKLSNQYEELKALIVKNGRQANNSSGASSDQYSSHQRVIRVGDYVLLKSITNLSRCVAKGRIYSMDPSAQVGGEELGPNWCEVHIQVPVKWDENLIRSYGFFKTVGDAIGAPIAWPLSLVALIED